jgi:predicted small secreted protein
LEFPKRVYTRKEVKNARQMVNKGYKHNLKVEGSSKFEQKVKEALKLVNTAGYYDFLRTYIRKIIEIDGLTQLRETEVEIWANNFAVENPVDAASLIIQKANNMKEYLEGKLYYGGIAEQRSVEKRIEFLEILKEKSLDESVKEECTRLLQMWEDSSTVF